MMKKTFIFFLVLVATAVQAEEREERDFFFVRAGVSLNKIAGKDAGNSKVCPLYDISLNIISNHIISVWYPCSSACNHALRQRDISTSTQEDT